MGFVQSSRQGKPGENGLSAYQQALNGGYTGTEEEFISELSKIALAWIIESNNAYIGSANTDLVKNIVTKNGSNTISGLLNIINGTRNNITGVQNITNGARNNILGGANYGGNIIVGGNNTIDRGTFNLISGAVNSVSGTWNIVLGSRNTIPVPSVLNDTKGTVNIMIGGNNFIEKDLNNNIILGAYNWSQSGGTFMFGYSLLSPAYYNKTCLLLGRANLPLTEEELGDNRIILEIGCGNDFSPSDVGSTPQDREQYLNRKTTLRIYGNGDIEIYDMIIPQPPTEDGNYRLSLSISNGVKTLNWVSDPVGG